jgi:hypothetical protein
MAKKTIWLFTWYNDNCDGGVCGYWTKKPTKSQIKKHIKTYLSEYDKKWPVKVDDLLLELTELG